MEYRYRTGVSLMLDMTGYELLAFHWVLSWGQSLVTFFWWRIFYHLLQEWDLYYKEQSHTRKEDFIYDDYPVQWLVIRAGQLCWMITLSFFKERVLNNLPILLYPGARAGTPALRG